MRIKTIERLQPQDDFYADVSKTPTDELLKDFKYGHLVTLRDRTAVITGIVGGFSSICSSFEQVFIKPKDPNIVKHTRHSAENIKLIKDHGKYETNTKANKTDGDLDSGSGKGAKESGEKLARKQKPNNKNANGGKDRKESKAARTTGKSKKTIKSKK